MVIFFRKSRLFKGCPRCASRYRFADSTQPFQAGRGQGKGKQLVILCQADMAQGIESACVQVGRSVTFGGTFGTQQGTFHRIQVKNHRRRIFRRRHRPAAAAYSRTASWRAAHRRLSAEAAGASACRSYTGCSKAAAGASALSGGAGERLVATSARYAASAIPSMLLLSP